MQNIVILAGNIGQSPEVRTTQGVTKITNFTLATSRPRLSEGRVQRDENGYRPTGMDGRRPCTHAGHHRVTLDRIAPMELEDRAESRQGRVIAALAGCLLSRRRQ
jgi:hypothetical protein